MRKLIISLGTVLALAACKPEVYTGPLDSPVGNWDGVRSDYYFNGKLVGEAEDCEYPAISFYKDGLCCIEGVKGAFPYSYENSTCRLVIDNTVWAVQTLTGAELVMEYLETIFTEEPEAKEDENVLTMPSEYDGVTINADENGYFYESGQERIYCRFFAARDEAGAILKDESGAVIIDFWYDHHIDHFIPLVIEVKK